MKLYQGWLVAVCCVLHACGLAGTSSLTGNADEATTSAGALIDEALASPSFAAALEQVGSQSMVDYARSLRAAAPSSLQEGTISLVITAEALRTAAAAADVAAQHYATVRDYWRGMGVTDAALEPAALSAALASIRIPAQYLKSDTGEPKGALGLVGPSAIYNLCKQGLRLASCNTEEGKYALYNDPSFWGGINGAPGLAHAAVSVGKLVKGGQPATVAKLTFFDTLIKVGPAIEAEQRAALGGTTNEAQQRLESKTSGEADFFDYSGFGFPWTGAQDN